MSDQDAQRIHDQGSTFTYRRAADGAVYDAETGELLTSLPAPIAPPAREERGLIFASPTCGEIFGALAKAQGKIKNPAKTATATVRGTTRQGNAYEYNYKYAPLDKVIEAISGPLSESGLAYRQILVQAGGKYFMRTVIGHTGTGEWFATDYPIIFDESKGAQGFASGVTYARRYGLMMATGVSGEDDDDGNVADGNAVQTPSAGATAPRPAARPAAPPKGKPAAQRPAQQPVEEFQEAPGGRPVRQPSTIDQAEASGSTHDPSTIAMPDQSQPAEPSPADREKSRTLYAAMSDAIDNCVFLDQLDQVKSSRDWNDTIAAIKKSEGTRAEGIIVRLETKLGKRKEEIEADAAAVDDEGPRTAGEMA